jgi:hypothetical protein
VQNLKIIAADSAAAILDEQFKPILHVASVSVLVELLSGNLLFGLLNRFSGKLTAGST